jgi:nucleoside-diphosphate-sugar epimerase
MILLTGTSGFIGSKLLIECINLFGQENVVILSSKKNENYPTILYENYKINAVDFSQSPFNKIKTVVHVGAFIPKSAADLNDILKSNSNIIFTQNLLSSLPTSVEKFIFLSSIDVYKKTDQVISENNPTIPETLYGFSKLYCEKMVEQWANTNNKIIQILRLGHVYGPGEGLFKKIIPVTMQKLKENEQPIIMGDGNSKRAFIYIEDVIFCVKEIMKFDHYKGPINIVNDQFVTIKDLVNQIIQVAESKISPEYITQEFSKNDIFFEANKLKSLINVEFTPMPIGLKNEWDSIVKKTK